MGSSLCPWMLNLHTGQRMRITLYSFGAPSSAEGESLAACPDLGTIIEGDKRKLLKACNSIERAKVIWVSRTSHVEVRLAAPLLLASMKGNYILHYEGEIMNTLWVQESMFIQQKA